MTNDSLGARFSRLIGTFRLPSIKKVVILIIIEAAVYWLGNPIIYDGLAWHHIPESLAALFFGMWMKEAKWRWWLILVLFVVGLASVILIYAAPALVATVIVFNIFVAFVSIGYYFGKAEAR